MRLDRESLRAAVGELTARDPHLALRQLGGRLQQRRRVLLRTQPPGERRIIPGRRVDGLMDPVGYAGHIAE